MEFCLGVDTDFIRENQVWNFKVEITDFRTLFKSQIHYTFILQKGDQIKILYL
jgi:hypothetical protein